jgi:hypothetical protein
MKRHRMQHICRDEHGVTRFRENKIVSYLLDKGGIDLNDLAGVGTFSTEDWRQFAQLIGYSVDGYCSLSYVSRAEQHRADDAEVAFLDKERAEAAKKSS